MVMNDAVSKNHLWFCFISPFGSGGFVIRSGPYICPKVRIPLVIFFPPPLLSPSFQQLPVGPLSNWNPLFYCTVNLIFKVLIFSTLFYVPMPLSLWRQDSIASTPTTFTLIAYCIYFFSWKALASHSICKTCFLIICSLHGNYCKHQNHDIWLIFDQNSQKITAKGVIKFLLFFL